MKERLLLSNAKLFSHCMLLIILKSDFRKFDANTKVAIAAGAVVYFLLLSMTCPCLDCGCCNAPLKAATATETETETETDAQTSSWNEA